jgi:NADPH:quinone reductase-like Zn-dependent oxidoreductase
MKAAVRYKYGTPEVLNIKDLEVPIPKENEVLIKISATTVNRSDCHVLWGKPVMIRVFTGLFKPRLASTGSDFAGQVEAVGKNVQSLKEGDKVMGFGGVFGCGSHTQYMTFPETKGIITMPDKLSYEEAAACLEGAVYAASIINTLKPKAGQKALVNGATGAIGSAKVQILKSYGVDVTAVCSSANIAIVQSLGADRVIDYTTEDFTKGDDQYDFIFDAVGKSTFSKCQQVLKKNGIYSSSDPDMFWAIITSLYGSKKSTFPQLPNIKAELNFIKTLIEKGSFKPLIDRKYPLEEIANAYEYVATGQKLGNVILNTTS